MKNLMSRIGRSYVGEEGVKAQSYPLPYKYASAMRIIL